MLRWEDFGISFSTSDGYRSYFHGTKVLSWTLIIILVVLLFILICSWCGLQWEKKEILERQSLKTVQLAPASGFPRGSRFSGLPRPSRRRFFF